MTLLFLTDQIQLTEHMGIGVPHSPQVIEDC